VGAPEDRANARTGDDDLEERLRECFGPMRDRTDLRARLLGDLAASVPAPPAAAGTLGDFRILREIGAGGMATVFEAEQISLGRKVALKILPEHRSRSRLAVEKFRREAIAAGRLNHPGIVSVYAVGEDKGIHFIAQELVEGGRTLARELEEMRAQGRPPRDHFRAAASTIASVAEALGSAHAHGVIHRDVKPSNILLTPTGDPKVGDFGLAKVEDALALSRTGDFMGTPFYMSPEQASTTRHGVDHRTDVFSLGVTLYESLTLERPFDGETSRDVIEKILHEEPLDPRRIDGRIPGDLAVICMKCMEKDPARRYPSMESLARDLRAQLRGEPIEARPPGPVRRASRWVRRHRLAFASAVGAAAILAALVLFAWEKHRERADAVARARRAFRPIDAVLEPSYTSLAFRIANLDPTDPSAPLLRALAEFGSLDRSSEVVSLLEACLDLCRKRGDAALEGEVRYLLDRLHEGVGTSPCAEAKFDPLSAESLVWEGDRPDGLRDPGGSGSPDPAAVLINENHFVVRLYRGMRIFIDLHLGGEVSDFEEAIGHFRAVLAARPRNLVARICLGRTLYFHALHFDFMDGALEARAELERALEISGDSPPHILLQTLGVVALLLGETDEAMRRFEEALARAPGRDCMDYHNILSGLGQALARKGRIDEAIARLEESIGILGWDFTANLALGELDLALGRAAEAHGRAQHAIQAWRASTLGPSAASYLLTVRSLIALGSYAEAGDLLLEMRASASLSVRDLALAMLLVPTLPDAHRPSSYALAGLLLRGRPSARIAGRVVPVWSSAEGVEAYLEGDIPAAIAHFEAAIRERERWPEAARAYHWDEDARDFYFLAISHQRAAEAPDGTESDATAAREWFERAEEAFRTKPLPFETGDILVRIRDTAAGALGPVR